jgi:hypothetical protein
MKGEINMTFSEILDMRDNEETNPGFNDSKYNKLYDTARYQIELLMQEGGLSVHSEDDLEEYSIEHDLQFDTHGNLTYRKEVKRRCLKT